MSTAFGFLGFLYIIIMLGILSFIIHLGLRFVKAIEKIANIYERKNS